jgi:hypothetical protein
MTRRTDLTDDELTAELRRRADDASLGADWARLQVLPAVRAGAAHGSVQPTRLARVAGLTAAVAVVLVLAVSVPLLTPGQPPGTSSPVPPPSSTVAPGTTASPAASPGSSSTAPEQLGEIAVMTAAEFAEALRADELEKQTVLVNAAIVPGPPVAQLECTPFYGAPPCYLGELEGVEPALTVSTERVATPQEQSTSSFNQPGIDWPHWWLPSPPVRGLLLLFVRGGTVQYVGRVHPDGSTLTWSVGEAKAVDPGSLKPDEILLVDGWLSGIGGALTCPSSPATIIGGLPNRWCSRSGWLFDGPDRNVRSPADRDGGVELQDQAYYQFALGPEPQRFGDGDGEPREGTYALAPRLEGWCPSEEAPCWEWSAVGRIAADFARVPARIIDCGHIERLDGSTSMTSSTNGIPTTINDETGLVENCIAGWAPPDASGVLVENPLPNAVTLDVSWPGTMCDISTALTFRQTDSAYELVGETQTAACPEAPPVRYSVMMSLATAVPAESVHVTIDGSIGKLPTPTPAPEPSVIPCTTDDHHAWVLDQSGYVDACLTVEGTTPVDSITLLDSGGAHPALRILWTGSACDDIPLFRLYQSGMRFTIEGELYGEPCGPESTAFEVQLRLNTDLPASAIDASMRRLGGPLPIPSQSVPTASAEFEKGGGSFTIGARAGKATYRAGELIDIAGEIVWNGTPGSTLEVFGGQTDAADGLVHFGWEQLDGDMQVGPRFIRSCKATTFEAGVPFTEPIAKETGNFGDQQHDGFWQQFFATPQLTLPPGRYRMMARAEFSIGECGPRQTIAYVPIFINVTQ